jgi:hypothetical protein
VNLLLDSDLSVQEPESSDPIRERIQGQTQRTVSRSRFINAKQSEVRVKAHSLDGGGGKRGWPRRVHTGDPKTSGFYGAL